MTIVVKTEQELYTVTKQVKSTDTIYVSLGIYNIGKFFKDMKRTMLLSYRKTKSQRKY